jgi:hypothetical protein
MSEPTSQPSETLASPSARGGRPPGVALVALVVAVIAVGLAVWPIFRVSEPSNASVSKPSADQISSAKAHACNVFKTVTTAVSLQTHADPGTDAAMQQAVAANSRLAMFGGGAYLTASLDPATPQDINTEMRAFATQLQSVSMNALAGMDNDAPDQAALLKAAQASTDRIQKFCA